MGGEDTGGGRGLGRGSPGPQLPGVRATAVAGGVVDRLFRQESGRAVATLIRVLGDFDLAEEAVQDAFAVALERWPTLGMPDNPAAWITTTARNRAIDRLRRDRRLAGRTETLGRLAALEAMGEPVSDSAIPDERLRLIFTCCHPALAIDAQVALTLRTLGGLTTPEIARAFLVPETTMAQRLVRAKRKIRDARIRRELCAEAIRLGRVLATLMPDEPEVLGLLALMLLQDSRREARVSPAGELVLLEEQDRSGWDRAEIEEGTALVDRALRVGRPGPYQLQAAIAALHGAAGRPEDTDWPQISLLYARLAEIRPTPVVELNRAAAVAMAEGPERGLELMAPLAPALEHYHLFHAARADLLRRLGRHDESAAAYRRALALVSNDVERRFLERRLRA